MIINNCYGFSIKLYFKNIFVSFLVLTSIYRWFFRNSTCMYFTSNEGKGAYQVHACDSCDQWYHQQCLVMHDIIYKSLTNISWECCNCGLPNFSTCIFNTTIFETSNSLSFLNSSNNDSEVSFTHPTATSSPTKNIEMKRNDLPLWILVLNCQSIKSQDKPAQLSNITTSSQADIAIGTESWLNPSVNSPDVFPPNVKWYRKDRLKQKVEGYSY